MRLVSVSWHMQVQESQQKAWWEEFLSEFFQENATLVIEVDFGEGTRKYRKWLYAMHGIVRYSMLCTSLLPFDRRFHFMYTHRAKCAT